MKTFIYTVILLVALAYCPISKAQNKPYAYIGGHSRLIYRPFSVYISLIHQHQNFFHNAFSLQGIELGVVVNHKFILAAYGSTFASTLDVNRLNNHLFVYTRQGGMLIGASQDNRKLFHAGCLLSAGYFSLVTSESKFTPFKIANPATRLHGFTVTPQLYGELNVTKWMRFRTGVGYTFYRFPLQSTVTKSDVETMAIVFGFTFGKFGK